MNHTHARRLVAAIVLVGGVALIPALTHSARSATPHSKSSPSGYSVSVYQRTTLLKTVNVANGNSLDIVWKTPACSNGYGSPPAAFTWSGGSTGETSAPVMGPCGHAPGAMRPSGPDDFRCDIFLNPPYINCYWTYKRSGGSDFNSSAKIANPGGGTVANAYLFKRTVLYAYLLKPGKAPQKIAVPAGGNIIKFAPAP